jgi:hypothetical protein
MGWKFLEDFRWLIKLGNIARPLNRSLGGNSGATIDTELSPRFEEKRTESEDPGGTLKIADLLGDFKISCLSSSLLLRMTYSCMSEITSGWKTALPLELFSTFSLIKGRNGRFSCDGVSVSSSID